MSKYDARAVVAGNLRALMDRARHERRLTHATAKQLEKVSGVSDSAINDYRKGEQTIKLDELAKLAAAFSLQPWELLREDFDIDEPPAAREARLKRMLEDARKLLGGE